MPKSAFLFAILMVAIPLCLGLDSNLPRPIFQMPSTMSSGGIFSDMPISDIIELPSGRVTFVGSKGVYIADILTQDIFLTFLQGQAIQAAVFVTEKNWWLVATKSCFHVLKLSAGTDISHCPTINAGGAPDGIKAIWYNFKDVNNKKNDNMMVQWYSGPTYMWHDVYVADGLVRTTRAQKWQLPGTNSRLGVVYKNSNLVNWEPTSSMLYIREEQPSPADNLVAQDLGYKINSVRAASNYLVVKSGDENCVYDIYTVTNEKKLVKTDTVKTKLTSRDKTSLSSLKEMFAISQGNLAEFYSIDSNGKAVLLYSSAEYQPFSELFDYVGSALGESVFFLKNPGNKKIISVSRKDWKLQSDSFIKIKATGEHFAEVPTSNLFSWKDMFTYCGKLSLQVTDAQRRHLKTITPVSGEQEIQSAFYSGDGKWIVGYVGRVLVVDLETGAVSAHENIQGVTSKVKDLYVVPKTQNLVIHQRMQPTIIYDLTARKVVASLNTLLKPDRSPVFINDQMVVYTTSNNYGEIFNLSSPNSSPLKWDHRYTPGINYIKLLNNSFIFVQSKETKTRYELWSTASWTVASSLPVEYGYQDARIQSFNPKSVVMVHSGAWMNVFSVAKDGTPKSIQTKVEHSFDEIYCIGTQDYNYIEVSGQNVREIDTTLYSTKAELSLDESVNIAFADGLRSNILRVRNSKLFTFVNQKDIIISNIEKDRSARTFRPRDAVIEAAYYSAEQDLWILGYDKEVWFYNIVSGDLWKYGGGLVGKVKELYRVPGTQKVLIHQRNASFILHDLETKTDTPFIGKVVPDRDPIFSGQIMLVYSSYASTAEVFNLSDVSQAPMVWSHPYISSGINYIVRAGNSNLLLVQTVNMKLSLWDSFIMKHLANVSTELTRPRIHGLRASSEFILSEGSQREIHRAGEEGVSLVSKKSGNPFSDVYFADFDSNYYAANEFLTLEYMDGQTHDRIYYFFVFQMSTYYQIPNCDIVGYFFNLNTHLFINEASLSYGKNLFNNLIRNFVNTHGKTLQITPISDNYNLLIIRTTNKTCIFDKIAEVFVAELEPSNAAIALPFRETILFQSSRDNVLRLYNWRRKEYLSQQLYLTDSKGAYVYNQKITSFQFWPNQYADFNNNYYDIVAFYEKSENEIEYALFSTYENRLNNDFISKKLDKNIPITANSCKKILVSNNIFYGCFKDNFVLGGFQSGANAFTSETQITTFQTRKIVDFAFSAQESTDKPYVGLLTAPKEGTGDVELEVWDMEEEEFISKTLIPGVKEGQVFYSGGFKVLPTESRFVVYDVANKCLQNEASLAAANGDSNEYCYENCNGKRIIFGAQRCAASCPLGNYTEQNYLGVSSNGKVCVPQPNFAKEISPIPIYNVSLTFDSSLNQTASNNVLCRLSQVLHLKNIRKEGVACSPSQIGRILQQVQIPSINSTTYVFEMFSHWALVDKTLDYLNKVLPNLPSLYNEGLTFGEVKLLNAKLLELVQSGLTPNTSDELSFKFLKVSNKANQIQVTVNASHPNLMTYLAWSENNSNATTPTVDSMRNLLDGARLPLSGLLSFQTLENGNVVFNVPKRKQGRVEYAFFIGGENLVQNNNLKSVVVRLNQSIDGDQEWGYAPGYSNFASNAGLQLLTFIFLAILFLF